MTVSEVIRPGDKVDISPIQQLESEKDLTKTYKSKVLDLKENGNIELSMPSEGGKLILLTLGVRYDLVFFSKGGLYRAIGQVKERYKSENVYMLEIELKSEIEKYQRREFFRYPCILDFSYYPITEEEVKIGSGDAIFIQLQEEKEKVERECRGRIVDLSGGGIRFQAAKELESGQYVLFEIHLQNESINKQYYIIGDVISCVQTDKRIDERFEVRAKFLIKENNIREEIIRFIFEEERKSRQRGR